MVIWNYIQQTQDTGSFPEKNKNWQLKFAVKIHEKYMRSLFLAKLQLSITFTRILSENFRKPIF